jgi:NAD-binding of NADP-dependent 3-hydroxyisobutyrate dehydrogenase
MAESQIGSPMLKLRVPLVIHPPDEAWFDIGLMHKDIRLARQAGAAHGTPLPTAGVADEILTTAEELGYTHRDIASMHDLLAHSAAPPPRSPGEPSSSLIGQRSPVRKASRSAANSVACWNRKPWAESG